MEHRLPVIKPMPSPRPVHARSMVSQRGAVLMLLLLLVGVGALAVFVTGLNRAGIQQERDRVTAAALAQAKEALIGYASAYDRPGALPCPDTNNDGSGDANAPNACYSRIGRLPWKSLKLTDLRDGYGERLWYAVSANFTNMPSTLIINSDDTIGTLNVCSIIGCGDPSPIPYPTTTPPFPVGKQLASLVFSSGPSVGDNNRQDIPDTNPDPAMNTNNANKAVNYLDSLTFGANVLNNATGSINGNDFISGVNGKIFNDVLIAIGPDEIFRNVDKRMSSLTTVKQIADCIAEYGKNNSTNADKRLPWAAPIVLTDYIDKIKYDDVVSKLAGRLPYMVDTSTSTISVHLWNTGTPSKKQKMAYCSNWPAWWESWKMHLFYAVADPFNPGSSIASFPLPCGQPGAKCLTVDGNGPYAAVVIFAGKKVAGQNRNTNSDKGDPTNYLEGINAISITNSDSSSSDYGKYSRVAGNDILVCVKQDLSIDTGCSSP